MTDLLICFNLALTAIALDAIRRTYNLVKQVLVMVQEHDADLRRMKARWIV